MKISNPSAFHEYTISDRFEAGIKLTGPEVKSVKLGHATLKGAYARILGSEAYLVHATISPYVYAQVPNYDPKRSRKLLVHKKELISLKTKVDSGGFTLVPISLYTHQGLVKVEVGLGRGKKQFEKREALKKRQEKRELDRVFRGKVK